MAKKSLTAQFDEIQARLEAAGMTVQREGKQSVKADIVLSKSDRRHLEWVGTIGIHRSPGRNRTDARVSINYVNQWADGESTLDVFAAILAKPFGHTTIGAVFGL